MKDQKSSSRDHYLSLYQNWKSSEVPVGLFCERASVKYATFRYWVKKFEQPGPAESGFTELRLNPGNAEPIAVLNFATGGSLSFNSCRIRLG